MSELRIWFIVISQSVKLSYYCDILGINSSNLSQWIKGNDSKLNYKKAIQLKQLIISDISNKIA